MGMDVRVNVSKKPFLCADSGPWRKLSTAAEPRQERGIVDVRVFVEHIYKCFLSVLS